MTGPRRGDSGAALVLTILGIVLLELMAHGALVLAGRHLAASTVDARILAARTAARGAVAEVPGLVAPDSAGGLRPGGTLEGTWDGASGVAVRWSVRRLSAEGWLGQGWARVDGAGWETREARPFWRLDPGARVAAFPAVVDVPASWEGEIPGRVEAAEPGEPCGELGAALGALLPAGLPPVARNPESGAGSPALGLLSWEELLLGTPVRLSPQGSPAPVDSGGVCATSHPWNWGDPLDTDGPCGGHRPWRGGDGDVLVVGGVGHGALVVLGDLELVGTDFRGLVLVRGALVLRQGAVVRGVVRAGGGLLVDAGSRILGSGCEALRALHATPEPLRALRPLPGVGWLPVP